MKELYLKIDEFPEIKDADIREGFVVKVHGRVGYIPSPKYEVIDKEEYEESIRRELWDNLQDAICGMSAYDFVSKFGTHLNNTFFESITPEEFLDICRQWQEEKDRRSYEKALVEKVREDIRKTVEPLCDIGYKVVVNIHKETEE